MIKKLLLINFAIMLITIIAFYQVYFNYFITLDDNAYVVHNPHIAKGMTLEGFFWAFNSINFGNWHPVTWLSHMLDIQFFGMNPAGHHATSLIIHIANTLLLSCFLVKITGAIWRSSIVALLFAVHPLHVESVAWVAERIYSMADRYTYLPLIGIFIIIAWWAEELSASFRIGKAVITLLFCAVFATLMTVTVQQVRFWQNSLTLFDHTRAVTRENATTCTNLGIAYAQINDSKNAIAFLNYAIRIDPRYSEAHYNLGLIYLGFGYKEQTLRKYNALIQLNSGYAEELHRFISFMGWEDAL